MAIIIGHPVESFTRGPDSGIDLRYKSRVDHILGQAKHYLRSAYSDLKTAIENEKVKLDKMSEAPTRYLLFTSLGLTPGRKKEILDLLAPYCRDVSDILGSEDIEGLIAANPSIEEHHYKLWLASARVLERIMGNATLTRSLIRIEETTERSRLFVPHRRLSTAERILRSEHSLIISGPPGIGKTTMAEMLALRLLASDYEVTFVTGVEELEREANKADKQLFVYDDFLGRTNFREAPSASSQEQLFSFMRWARKKPGKYLVMTTREYLYREAKAANERLRESRADIVKCLLNVAGYDRRARARILYNHLYWTPGIPTDDLHTFIDSRGYWDVINHENFNPRWIADTLNRLTLGTTLGELGDTEWT